MTGGLFVALALLVWVAGIAAWRSRRSPPGDREPWEGEWDDDPDSPLDEKEAREAEDRFWAEDWDPPEPWE